jgi:hypothetical protein
VGLNGTTRWCLLACLGLGCTQLAGIDGDYVPNQGAPSTGGGSSGGFVGVGGDTGGTFATGGSLGSGDVGGGGAGGSESADAGPGGSAGSCAGGDKRCADACVAPSIANGCASADCVPCPLPTRANAEAFCDPASACGIRCAPGFEQNGAGECAPGTGGSGGTSATGGTSGSSGTGGACDLAPCPCPGATSSCCLSATQCGCRYVVPLCVPAIP